MTVPDSAVAVRWTACRAEVGHRAGGGWERAGAALHEVTGVAGIAVAARAGANAGMRVERQAGAAKLHRVKLTGACWRAASARTCVCHSFHRSLNSMVEGSSGFLVSDLEVGFDAFCIQGECTVDGECFLRTKRCTWRDVAI